MAESLNQIAQAMVAPGKGILAADESTGTIGKRFASINTENTETNRRDYRQMLFSTSDAMQNYVSGVILYDETLRQKASDGTPIAELIKQSGAIPGIKVDTGAKDLAGFPGEKITEGLDGLRERLIEYYALGARFAKWRGVITIDGDLPSRGCIRANAQALARYAALCQEQNIVPIVEPEVLMDNPGANHDIKRTYKVTKAVLKAVFKELEIQRVALDGIVLKPNMIVPGKECADQASPELVAQKTLKVLRKCVPTQVPGIAFLSGGQADLQATHHLSLMNAQGDLPWALTFSYGRALQAAALQTWAGNEENVAAAQASFTHRAQMNSLASRGEWAQANEQAA